MAHCIREYHGPGNSEDYYTILGAARTSTIAQINAEYKARVRYCHPDKNQDDQDETSALFKKLQEAKDCLTDPQKRMNYDRWLDCGLDISFKEWNALKDRNHMTMHWSNTRQGNPMIDHPETTNSPVQELDRKWQSVKADSILAKFRNYEV